MGGARAAMQYLLALWSEWEIQAVVVLSFSLQVILFFFAGIRRYTVSSVLKSLLWLVYLLADLADAIGHMSSSLSKKSSGENQLVAFWAPFLLLHLGGQDTITAYALEDNELWMRHLMNMLVQIAGTAYVLYKYIIAGGATFVHATMLVLAAGVVKYGERIWSMKRATKKGSKWPSSGLESTYGPLREKSSMDSLFRKPKYEGDCFTKNKQFSTYAFAVMTAHILRYIIVKPLIIDRIEESIGQNRWTAMIPIIGGVGREYLSDDYKSEDSAEQTKMQIQEVYRAIEVELALMYDILYTKAQVIHTWYGYCIRAISLVSCLVALVFFTKSKRDGYSTPDIVITFALLGGACALEIASVFRAIGSTWTCEILRRYGWKWLANAILYTRYHLIIIRDGRWSYSFGQCNLISFCVHSNKNVLKGRIAHLIGLRDLWTKARCTKHAKSSPSQMKFVWDLLIGQKPHMVRIEAVATEKNGYWARRLRGFDLLEQLDWSLNSEFQVSVLVWHIATGTFLNHPVIKCELDMYMAEAVNTLSDYMMYLLIEHPGILPIKAAVENLFDETCTSYSADMRKWNADTASEPHELIMDYKERRVGNIRKLYGDLTQDKWDVYSGEAVLVKACTLAHTMVDMKLGLTHKMVIFGTVWTEMLCYAATNASEDFHARQLSNGGEFLTHILLLSAYAAAKRQIEMQSKAADKTVEDSDAGHVKLNVENGFKDEIIEIP